MKVEVIGLASGQPKIICTWTLTGDQKAVCDNPISQENMEELGALSGGKTFYPKDGEAFLRALSVQYSGSYVRTRLVE